MHTGMCTEALKLLPPSACPYATTKYAAPSAPQSETLLAMVSTKHGKPPSDSSAAVMDAVRQLSKDVHKLRLEVTQLGQDYGRYASHCAPHAELNTSTTLLINQWGECGRERYRCSPSVSPDRGVYYSAAHHQRSSRSHGDHLHPKYSPGHGNRRYSPSSPSSPHHHRDHYSTSSQDRFRHHSPDGHRPPNHFDARYPHQNDSYRHTSYSPPHESAKPRYEERPSPYT